MSESKSPSPEPTAPVPAEAERLPDAPVAPVAPREIGGHTSGLDPTRYGDWEKNGRCIDF